MRETHQRTSAGILAAARGFHSLIPVGGALQFLLDQVTATDLVFCQWTRLLTTKIGIAPKNYF
ncbi:RIKEN cDNA 3110040N11, isoform CRA_a [Mus musculus]|nr:RIKEN cDNA 3110040N11, isoform CRA_a [Mus musculus]EDL06923.1 RIKEN cDNA 3110040N11, isoform CRA_a [Mus musculus]